MSEHPIVARFYDRLTAGTEHAGLGEMRRRAARLGEGPGARAGGGHRPQPPVLHRRGHGAGHDRARPSHGRPAARQAGRGGDRGRQAVGGRLTGRGPSLRRRQLRHRGRHARALHGQGPRSARSPRPAGCWSRAAGCSSSSTSGAVPPGSAWWQDRLERPWGFLAGGCHPNRATDQLLADAGFWIDSIERTRLPKAPPIARPLIRGVAQRPSGVGSG